jgi:arsenate reductase
MATPLVLAYANCDTCRKALRWLEARGVKPAVRPIVDAASDETLR